MEAKRSKRKRAAREKPAVTLPGTVEKIVQPINPSLPEKAQIGLEGADHLYREIRVENTLTDGDGKTVGLKPGAEVEVTIEADPEETRPKAAVGSTEDGNDESTSTEQEDDESEAEPRGKARRASSNS